VRAEARESMAQTRRNASNAGRIITEIMKLALNEKRALLAHLQKEISDLKPVLPNLKISLLSVDKDETTHT
jgi:hypothetical protein